MVPVSVDLGKLSDRAENDIAKKTEYDELVNMLTTLRLKIMINYDKLKNLNKKVTSNKTKHVLVQSELNKLSEKIKPILTKGLIKDIKNYYSILNGGKYFVENGSQNYLVFRPFS